MVEIRIVGDHYAAVAEGKVIAIIERYSDVGWRVESITPSYGVCGPVPLADAIRHALNNVPI